MQFSKEHNNPAIRRAERLRIIMAMPEYESTIGQWIDEAHKNALHQLTTAIDPREVHQAQGAFKLVTEIKEQFDHVFNAEKSALRKMQKNTLKGIANDRRNGSPDSSTDSPNDSDPATSTSY
jgi:hypothetical protein